VVIRNLSQGVFNKIRRERCNFNIRVLSEIMSASPATPWEEDIVLAMSTTCEICKFRLYKAGGGNCANKDFVARSA